MIAKITRGDDMGGLVRYLLGPGRANEHTDMRVVAAGVGIDVPTGQELGRDARLHLVDQLDGPHAVAGAAVPGGHVWHMSLTTRAEDRTMSDDEWADAARTAMAALDFDSGDPSGRAPTPWVAVRHGKSSGGHDHVHIAVSLVREDGTRASIWQDRVKASGVCRQLEERYGLSVVEGRTAGATPVPSRAEHEIAARTGAKEPDRLCLARAVRGAAAASRNEAEFVRRLRSQQVLCRPRYAKESQSRVVGYSVARGGSTKPVWFGGGRLARDLTLPALRGGWERVEDQGAAWRTGGSADSARRETVVIGADAWREAARRARAVTERLVEVPPGDRAAWANAARDAAGVLASLSSRFEGDEPGPLAAAADVLARSAQRNDHRPERRSDLSGLATVAAQAAMVAGKGSGAAGWLLVVAEILRLAQAVERAHAARGELARARELAARHEALGRHHGWREPVGLSGQDPTVSPTRVERDDFER